MTTIKKNADLLTLINLFRVEPQNQDRVVQMLVEATETVMARLPGFVSANIHRGLDGRTVVNYVQWESFEDFKAIFENEEATRHMQALRPFLVSSERNLYNVVSVHSNREAPCLS